MVAVNLAFDEFGNENAPPLLILHGFFASSRNWRQIAEKLSANFHVYVLDMRNHGVSAHHPVMDYPAMAEDVRQFIRRLGLEKVSLLGHSMGGKVAMCLALESPDLIAKLVVVDIAPVSYQHSFDDLILALKALPLTQLSNRKQAEVWLAESIPELSYRQFLLQNLILNDGEYSWRINLDIFFRTAANIIAFPEQHGVSPFAGDALFIAGGDSNYFQPGNADVLFPGAEITIIPDAGHWVHVQNPEAFIAAVEAFCFK
ncbi:MAG: alpha/beta fold hydrolase [Methylococcales bacterium]|nr:alpha/beta fold hydrolase [Methylococcaceae bacterium]